MEEVVGRDLPAQVPCWCISELFAVPSLAPVIELGEVVHLLFFGDEHLRVIAKQSIQGCCPALLGPHTKEMGSRLCFPEPEYAPGLAQLAPQGTFKSSQHQVLRIRFISLRQAEVAEFLGSVVALAASARSATRRGRRS